MNQIIRLSLISPLFSYGVYDAHPEIRAPSIRGQLHWWFRALGGNYVNEREIFGGVSVHRSHPNKNLHRDRASRLIVRVEELEVSRSEARRLPHKHGGEAAPRKTLSTGSTFNLHLSWRLSPPSKPARELFERTFRAWILAGSLGTRATRGSGALQPDDFPKTAEEWRTEMTNLMGDCSLSAHVLSKPYSDHESARKVVTDTIGGPFRKNDWDDLRQYNWPLGDVATSKQCKDDSTRIKRKTSPLRLTLRRFDDGIRIITVWDGRKNVTGNDESDLRGAIKLLQEAGKPIGDQLAETWKGA